MAQALFISVNDLTQLSIINGNVDSKLLTPIIELAQDKYVMNLIGSGIYNQIQTQIEADTVSAANKTLLDKFIQPCLIWYTIFESPVFLNIKFENKAVVRKNSDNSTPLGSDEMIFAADNILHNAQFYAERMRRFLLANPTTYPLYLNPGSTIDTIWPQQQSYDSGIFLELTPRQYAERNAAYYTRSYDPRWWFGDQW